MTSALTLHEHWARISRDAWATVTTAGDKDAAVMIRMPGFRTGLVWRIRLAANARPPVPGWRFQGDGFRVAASGRQWAARCYGGCVLRDSRSFPQWLPIYLAPRLPTSQDSSPEARHYTNLVSVHLSALLSQILSPYRLAHSERMALSIGLLTTLGL